MVETNIWWSLGPGCDLILSVDRADSTLDKPVQVEIGFHFAQETRWPEAVGVRLLASKTGAESRESTFVLPLATSLFSVFPHPLPGGEAYEISSIDPSGETNAPIVIPCDGAPREHRLPEPIRFEAGSSFAGHVALALAAVDGGDRFQAVEHFRKAVGIRPQGLLTALPSSARSRVEVLEALAAAQVAEGNMDQGAETLSAALELSKADTNTQPAVIQDMERLLQRYRQAAEARPGEVFRRRR